MAKLWWIIVTLIAATFGFELPTRQQKFLNVFQIIKFPNSACNATSSTEGTCYTSAECSNKGGENSGTCANGFGVCCVFIQGCGKTATENNTYFSSTVGYSSPCVFTICRIKEGICQIRLDFDTFVLTQPESSTTPKVTNCIDARFSATSQGASIPVLCGTNTGKHMYLESIEDCNYLQVTTRPGVSTPNFNIQISQIPCTASYLAPQGCLQYFTGTSGTVESYNIDGGVHLANQYYTICIRTEENYCTIKYDDTTYSLSAGNSVEGDDCTEDYIIIPDNAKNNNRYCGNSFASVDTYQRPFEVVVNFDGADSATNRLQGFKLTFTQTTDDCV